jgi:uncharacterized protein YhaN
MRIDEIAVDGFGLLHDLTVAPAPGLTIVRGENEAGKTSLMAFIRAILFGFDPRAYPALAGGRRGGHLTVSMADGTVRRIERYGTAEGGGRGQLRVLDERDVELDAAAIDRLLQGVNRAVFSNVFAFGLSELASFETLTGPDIAARIYGAGLGTGGVSALATEKALQGELESLFKPGGENQRINRALSEIEDVDARLAGRDLPAAYGATKRRLEELEAELGSLRREDERLGAGERRLERLVLGWSPWLALRKARADLDALPDARPLPPDTTERLARIEEALATTTERHERAAPQAAKARETAAAIVVDDTLLAARDRIEAVLEADRAMRARADDLARQQRDAAVAREKADERIHRLGRGWDDTRVVAFDDSLAVHAAIAQHRSALERVRHESRQAADAAAGVDRERGSLQAEITEIDARIGAAQGRTEATDADGATLRGTPVAGGERTLDEREAVLRRLEAVVARRETLETTVAALEADLVAPPRGTSPLRVAALVAAVAGIAGGGVALAGGGGPGVAGIVLVAGLAIAFLALVVERGGASSRPTVGRSTSAGGLRRDVARLSGEIVDLATTVGVSVQPEQVDFDRVRADLAATRLRDAEVGGLQVQRRALAARGMRLAEREVAARSARAAADAALATAVAAWTSWLAALELDSSLDPEGAARVVDGVTSAKEHVRLVAAFDARIAALIAERAAAADDARRLLESLGRTGGIADIPAALAALRVDRDRAVAADAARRRAAEEAERLAADEQEARERLDASLAGLNALLAACGADDGADVRRTLELEARRAAIAADVESATGKLAALSGPDAALERFLGELTAVVEIAEVRDRLAAASIEHDAVRVRQSEAEREYGSLRDEAAGMERAVEATVDRQRSADLAATLRSEAERWTVRALALAILRRTRDRYEREHRPDVLRIAERLVAEWSAGRYVRIVAPLGAQAEELERWDGKRVPLAGLSTGTAQQLYLALRFGLIEHFSTVGESLPIVMDDILVNFDEPRSERAARSIEDLASRHQVLYFTCHPATPLRAGVEIALEPLVPAAGTI